MRQDEYLLGYFAYIQTTQRAYYAGLLVTNTRGVPKEFRHSEAVKPSRLQATLYGDSLESSLGTDALAPALYNALTDKPSVLLIDREGRNLFGSFAHAHHSAALLVPLDDPDKAFADMLCSEGSLLEAIDYDYKGSKTERIYAYIEEEPGQDTGRRTLAQAQKTMNLLSPFDRIRMVLTEIAQLEQGRNKA
jgi:hypothetical protein